MSSDRAFTKRQRHLHVGLTTMFDIIVLAALLYCIYGVYVSMVYEGSVWTQWTETHTFLVFMTVVGGTLSYIIHNAHHREGYTARFSLRRAVGSTVGAALIFPPVLLLIPMPFVGVEFQDFGLRWLILAVAISPIGFRGMAYQYYEEAAEEDPALPAE